MNATAKKLFWPDMLANNQYTSFDTVDKCQVDSQFSNSNILNS
jgi:hypothetical protein